MRWVDKAYEFARSLPPKVKKEKEEKGIGRGQQSRYRSGSAAHKPITVIDTEICHEMIEHDIVIYGAGAVGSSVGGWLAPHCPSLSLLSHGDHAAAMSQRGLTVFLKKDAKRPAPVPVSVITDLSERPKADIIVIAVKNYSLADASRDIAAKLRSEPLIVALQNGLENREILPKYFKRIIYGVVCYNSWREAPGVVGANRKGPILLGVPDNDPSLAGDLGEVHRIFSLGLDARITPDLRNASMTKMIVNLSNAILTLVGHGYREILSPRALKHIMIGSMLEGFDIARGAGFTAAPVPGAPSPGMIRFSTVLPEFLSDILFKANLASVDLNSMGQDILQHGRGVTELESLTGYFVGIADTAGIAAPYSRTIYDLCRKKFTERPFVPMDETTVWREIERRN
jgi:2-dehydropantoate 2-reductase